MTRMRSVFALLAVTIAVVAALFVTSATARAGADDEAAKVHFLSGQAYYDQANYQDALREFNEAYRISNRPALLYNVALCHERLEHYAEAIAALEQYLVRSPDADDRVTVESRIKNLRERRDHAAPPAPSTVVAPPVAVAAPPVADVRPRKRVATWVVGGLGLGLLVGTLASGIIAKERFDSLKSDCGGFTCDTAKVPDAASRQSAGKTAAVATDVMWPVGTVAVLVAVVLYFAEGRTPAAKPRALLPRLTTDGVAVRF